MSLLWFVILSIACGKGIEIDNISFMMIAIFYVGDCILMRNGRANDGKID